MNKELINQIYNQGVLDFFWVAVRKDDSTLCQFKQTGDTVEETPFAGVDQHPEHFKSFKLISLKDETITFEVDLETGDFLFKGVRLKNNIEIADSQLKCSFWRRKFITMNLSLSKESSKYLCYILGWHTNIDGVNIKKEYQIFPDFSVKEILHKQSRKLFAKAKIT